ncbi:MAG TPA: L-seryl-tRNA(Sec) selenium transferase [Candidatus Obscuribacterales bacterium]
MPVDASKIPQVEKLLNHPVLVALKARVRRPILVKLARDELSQLRAKLRSAKEDAPEPLAARDELNEDAIAQRIETKVGELLRPHIRPVINGTGVVLNTNLGRAPLPEAVAHYLAQLSESYCNLEIDLPSGKRGERLQRIDELARLLTGCEKAVVVNNNASSVMLAVAALSRGKEVIVSRGDLIEIGGSFRLPDVIESAGGILKEVGTTNRTRLSDYKRAIGKNTGFLLKCHRSNFAITGFTEETATFELAKLGSESGVPVLMDLGSGAMVDFESLGLPPEPTIATAIKDGVDAVMFSGDKLMGGPQAGVVAGKKALIETLRSHPIYRALRADKLTIAYLEQVMALYLAPNGEENIPALMMASSKESALKRRVEHFLSTLGGKEGKLIFACAATESALGGGTIPGQTLSSWALEIRPAADSGLSVSQLAQILRLAEPPVIGVVRDDRLLIDFRTVRDADEQPLFNAISQVGKQL